jgi:hypothetical protein
MIYEVAWLAFALGIMVLLSIGLLGLFFSFSISSPLIKNCAMVLSVLIIFAGLYFSYKWTTNKKNIQNLTQRVEQIMRQYGAEHQLK